MQLQARVRNVTADYPSGGQYSFSQVEAESGDVLEYRIAYENNGVTPVRDVVIKAAIPPETHLQLDGYGPSQYIAWIGQQGIASYDTAGITVTIGDLLPSQSGAFTYHA